MKPRWEDAPTWANYLAWDDGTHGCCWYWHQKKPYYTPFNTLGPAISNGLSQPAHVRREDTQGAEAKPEST